MQDLIDAARADIRLGAADGRGVCLTSSFQAECVVLTHLMIQDYPDVPVLFLDTGYHFPETYQYRDEIAKMFNLNLVNLMPRQTVAEQESAFGILYKTAPDRCCAMRKVEPLFAGLSGYDVWFTALRREQSPTRANLQVFENFRLPQGKVLSKVSPLAGWKTANIWDYLHKNSIPVLPLYDAGYTSIGCQPCTIRPADPEDLRSGRWAGKQKLECGIHISTGVSN